MFHPVGHPLERGWVGRVEDDRVVQLAAQTLQAFFTGGGTAREHAEYPLADVRFLAPVLHPPAVRLFEDQSSFVFGNPASVVGPDVVVRTPDPAGALSVAARVGAIVGAEGAIGAYTVVAEWRDVRRQAPKDRDFALGLGPVAVTADEFDPAGGANVVRVDGEERARTSAPELDWKSAIALAADGTRLYPGDVLAGPTGGVVGEIHAGATVELEVIGIGVLTQRVATTPRVGE
jgi:hypothetical protein